MPQVSDVAAMTLLIAVPAVFIARAANVFGCCYSLCRMCDAFAYFEYTIHFGVIAGGRLLANLLYHRHEFFVKRENKRQRAIIRKKFFKLK